jgi:serine/threonine protein phosphatase PrpC
VAEMDYMSEGSNLSLKGLQQATASVLGGETDVDNTLDEAAVQAASANFVAPSVSQFFVNKQQQLCFLPITTTAAGTAAATAVATTTQDLSQNCISKRKLSSFRRYHASGASGITSGGSSGTVSMGGNNIQPALTSLSSFRNRTNITTAAGSTSISSNLRLRKEEPAASLVASAAGGASGDEGGGGRISNNSNGSSLGTRFMSSAAASSTSNFSSGNGVRSSMLGAETIIQPPESLDTHGDHHRKSSANSAGETLEGEHQPFCLPTFRNTSMCMWTASHAANYPTEDRSASLVNLLLQPLPPGYDSETQLSPLEPDYKTLIRLNLWAVIDGHGGGCVATYASEVLLPHIAASISRALDCAIVDRGVCTVNGQLRDANALDLDGLIKTSDRSMGKPYSIHYRSPFERSDSEEEEGGGGDVNDVPGQTAAGRKQIASLAKDQPSMLAEAGSMMQSESAADASVSSVKTSLKTAASPGANQEAILGTHSPREVAAITRAITESFLAVDEGWINSIDPVATHQTSCQSNGRWNSGACALVVFTIQRLDWTSVSEPDREKESPGPEKSRRNTSQNRDAARRRMLDYAARAKSASSMSTDSSTSSLTTEEAVNASGLESEITETEGEDDRINVADVRKRNPYRASTRASQFHEESLISPPGGCSCHCYRAHDAILYTAHVGDCRAVMLGSAPPRTIKVRGRDANTHPDTTDDESSHHSSDETECLSSSDHDADSSEDDDLEIAEGSSANAATSSYMNFPRRVVRQRNSRRASDDFSGPFTPLPPIESKDENASKRVEFDFDTDTAGRELRRLNAAKDPSDSSTSSQDSEDLLPLVHLAPVTRPVSFCPRVQLSHLIQSFLPASSFVIFSLEAHDLLLSVKQLTFPKPLSPSSVALFLSLRLI